ncbi:hypothetical protein B0H67DRAFT_594097 [Lasiosphaeris hirsuta]|uniref:Uncharacterized protein n=1 Tax=Lasiosphaeris hirsuta TaxID=260670 RepID=A0AA39ZXI9_9PEZI|nr:hypothetical protein B0H67DRAFT_594097 [Lasiosphaeris hirsuta]
MGGSCFYNDTLAAGSAPAILRSTSVPSMPFPGSFSTLVPDLSGQGHPRRHPPFGVGWLPSGRMMNWPCPHGWARLRTPERDQPILLLASAQIGFSIVDSR